MKRFAWLFWLIPAGVSAQFSDSFSDGDFTSNPTWLGTTENFQVNGAQSLQSNGPAQSDTAFLYTSTNLDYSDTVVWEAYWRMAFAPSDNNTSRIYLMASSPDLSSPQNQGYFLRIGNSGSDSLRFYRNNGSTATLLATGSADYSASPALRIRVTRTPTGLWIIDADPLGGTAFSNEITVTDNTFQSASRFGLWCKYTSSNNTKFYFDDIVVSGTPYVDDEPPIIASVLAQGNTSIRAGFNEPLIPAPAQLATNFSLSGGIGISAATPGETASEVVLTLVNAPTVGTSYTLTASNQQDTAGNTQTSTSFAFVFQPFDDPQTGSILITEIMADPSPVVGLPEGEYLELHNAATAYIDLSGATISDGSTTGVLPAGSALAPDEYVILCGQGDSVAFASYGRVVVPSSFPGLNNTGDELALRIGNVLLDRVTYSDAWYNDGSKANGGYSLELINPSERCAGSDNWTASNAPSGGTPGQVNSVLDTVYASGLNLDDFELNGTTLTLFFNKRLDSASVFEADYALTDRTIVGVQSSGPDFNTVDLNINAPLDSSGIFTLTVSGLSSCSGQSSGALSRIIALGVAAQPGYLVINELHPDPTDDKTIPPAEFVEVYNRSPYPVRLAGTRIHDATGSAALPNKIIMPGTYFIVCDDAHLEAFSAFGFVVYVGSMPSLNNSDDRIALMRGKTLIDEVNYDESWYGTTGSGSGVSLERINYDDLCGVHGTWRPSIHPDGGTPGKANSVLDTTSYTLDPKVTSWTYDHATRALIMTFNMRMDSSHFQTRPVDEFEVVTVSSDGATVLVTLLQSVAPEPGQLRALSDLEVVTCAGETLFMPLPALYVPKDGDVIINEVLFNPRGSGSDYVELFNTSSHEINLSEWGLGYQDSDDSLRINYLSSGHLIFPPGSYLLLHEDSADIATNYPVAASQVFVEMNLPTYSNDAGSVALYDNRRQQVEQFSYSEDMHFALIDDPDGVALERLSPTRAAADAGNWNSAASTENYGTPGYKNSQSYQSAATDNFSLFKDMFSPDNDGYEDVVTIDYSGIQAGTVASIRVYNDRGIPVATIASNVTLSEEGSFTWNGIADDGQKARTGVHLIMVETFDLEGKSAQYRLPVVVAAKL